MTVYNVIPSSATNIASTKCKAVRDAINEHHHDAFLEVAMAWPGPQGLPDAIAGVESEGFTDPVQIALVLVQRAKAERAKKQAEKQAQEETAAILKNGVKRVSKLKVLKETAEQAKCLTSNGTDTQDAQEPQTSNELQDSHRLTPESLRDQPCKRKDHDEFLSLPFDQFLIKAYQYNQNAMEEYYDTKSPDSWRTTLFAFVRLVKGHKIMEQYISSNGSAALAIVESALGKWSRATFPKGGNPNAGDDWSTWFGLSKEEARTEFLDVWERVRYRPGETPLRQAIANAKRLHVMLSDENRRRRGIDLATHGPWNERDYEFFVGVAAHLQTIMGDRNIYLPRRLTAELLGVMPNTISRWVGWAVKDELLKLEAKYAKRVGAPSWEYRFDVSRWKPLAEKAGKATVEGFIRPD